MFTVQRKKTKQTNNETKRTTIIMQLVRIWQLKESNQREEKRLSEDKKICTKNPERKKKIFYLTCLFTSTDRTTC